MTAINTAELILVIKVSDRATDAYLDRIEKAAGAPIAAHKDDSCGTMTLFIKPRVRLTKPQRKAALEAVQAIAPRAYWA